MLVVYSRNVGARDFHAGIFDNRFHHVIATRQETNVSILAGVCAIPQHAKINLDTIFSDIHRAYGCNLDVITLQCSGEATVNVTSAVFGLYSRPCQVACCAPHPVDDCTEPMQNYQPLEWQLLKATCDNETTCDWENRGGLAQSCPSPYSADFLVITYTCSPGSCDDDCLF